MIESQQQLNVKQVVDLVVVLKVNRHHVEQRKEEEEVVDMVENNLQLHIHRMDKMVQVNQVLKNFYQELFVFVGLFHLKVKFVFVFVLFRMKLDNLIKQYHLKLLEQNEIIKYFVVVFVHFQQLVENLG